MSRHGSSTAGSCWVATGVFPGCDRVVFSWFYIATGVPTVSRQCFVLCHDNVAIEVSLLGSSRSRHEVRVATKLG